MRTKHTINSSSVIAVFILILTIALISSLALGLYTVFNLSQKIDYLESENSQLKEQVESLTEQLHEEIRSDIKLKPVIYAIDDYIRSLESASFDTSDGLISDFKRSFIESSHEKMHESMKKNFPESPDNATVSDFADFYFKK